MNSFRVAQRRGGVAPLQPTLGAFEEDGGDDDGGSASGAPATAFPAAGTTAGTHAGSSSASQPPPPPLVDGSGADFKARGVEAAQAGDLGAALHAFSQVDRTAQGGPEPWPQGVAARGLSVACVLGLSGPPLVPVHAGRWQPSPRHRSW
jgi:hypothetical protein